MIQKISSKFSTMVGLLKDQYSNRSKYGSLRNQLLALRLRISVTPPGKIWFRRKTVELTVAGLPTPLTIRQCSSDFSLIEHILEQGEYEPVTGWSLPDNPVILDLGSNIGISCLYFATLFPKCRVIALEPDQTNAELLVKNCKHLVDSGRLTIVKGFVSAKDGFASLDRDGESWAFKKSLDNSAGEQIPCYSVLTLLEKYGIQQVDLLKCDIEGSEAEIFAGCSAWIGKVHHIAVETHAPYFLQDFYRDLSSAGWHFEPPLRETQDSVFGKSFVRRIEE